MAAMQVVDVNLDLEEMVIHFKEERHPEKIPYKEIERIQLSQTEVRKWFVKKKVNQLEVHVKGKNETFLLQDGQLKAPFEATAEFFKNHAQKFNIEFVE